MANENLPNIISNLTDRNLDTARVVDLGDSVLVIGTSARGPVNQPIRIYNPQDAVDIFGPINQGTLVRGFSEVYFGPGGVKDIRLCRISDGSRAILELEEKLGTMESKESYESFGGEQIVALRVQARDPGDIYNQVSFRQEIIDGQLAVVGYNPITGLETQIPYDPLGLKAKSVADVVELANAINLDPNLNGIVVATPNEINIEYELAVKDTDVAASGTFGTESGGTLYIDLGEALDEADANDDSYTDDTDIVSPSGVPVTAGNRLVRLKEVYELADVKVELDAGGYTSVALPYPVQVTGTTAKKFLKLDLTEDVGGGGKAIHKIVNAFIATGDGEEKDFSFTAYETVDTSTFKLYRTSAAGTTVEVDASEFDITKDGGSANNYEAAIKFKTAAAAPAEDSVLTITYDSEEFQLTQSSTLQACKDSNSYATYFAAGDRVTFGTAQPADIVVAYQAKKIYKIDVDVTISDKKSGKVHFGNPNKQPDYANDTVLGFDYDYQPEWVNLGAGARSLQAGSNGIQMNNKEKYDVLKDCYEAIEDYEVDAIVLMNSYVDDTKVVYDEETGLPVEVNAGFAEQFAAYLATLQDGVNETYGIMAVKAAEGTAPADVKDWYTKLTTTSTLDKTRAANVMAGLDSKHISVVAFEPIVANNSVGYPYGTTGEAVYAGMVCKLPITSAPTNKPLGTQVVACRFKLSSRQLDSLVAARYVTTKLTPANNWVITDAMTAAAVGSDYARFSTLRIAFYSMDVVRSGGRPFIGELFNPAKRAALETAISRGLLDLQEQGALRKFDFRIEQTPAERALGVARIPLTLWPEFELRRIEVTVKLSNT